MVKTDKSHRIGLIVFPGAMDSAMSGLEDVFEYVAAANGIEIEVPRISFESRARYDDFDAVLLPPAKKPVVTTASPWVIDAIKTLSASGCLIAAACAGVHWVAAAGVDRGRPVTTHWKLADEIKDKWPNLNVSIYEILTEHNDLITAGGMMSWMDLALVVIDRVVGIEAAQDAARHFVVDFARRDQRRYSRFIPELQHGDSKILAAQRLLEERIQPAPGVRELASHIGMTERTFLRRFERATALTPKSYQQNLRVELARELLLQTDRPVSQIGYDVGYTDPTAFVRIFARIAGQSPAAFRKSFRPQRHNRAFETTG